MEPLTVLGALASAGQLCEMALKYSYKHTTSYRPSSTPKSTPPFCNKVNHHKRSAMSDIISVTCQKLIRLPAAGLQEANTLMRNLQFYIERLRNNPPSDHYLTAVYSIREISEQFASDMICLDELLPYDMASFSASVRKRTQFVLKKKDTDKILRRLEDRKRSATLALEIIGR